MTSSVEGHHGVYRGTLILAVGFTAQLKREGVEKIRSMVVTGPPAIQVVGIAKETPNILVVMSTHGHSDVGQFVLGSVADRVVLHAGSPALLMRAWGIGTNASVSVALGGLGHRPLNRQAI